MFKNIFSKKKSNSGIEFHKEVLDLVCDKNEKLVDLQSRVGLVLDFSGSMDHLYSNGTVQTLLERIVPLALRFDDNKSLDFWIFHHGYHRLEDVTIDNLDNFISKVIKRYRMGGTNYAPVISDVKYRYINEEPSDLPSYLIFITDGDNSDKPETSRLLREYSKHPIFWQFVGIGCNDFSYLEDLDNLCDRFIDNANFLKIKNLDKIDDESLYNKLLFEYPNWISEAKNAGILK